MKNKNCSNRFHCDDYQHNHCDGCGANDSFYSAGLKDADRKQGEWICDYNYLDCKCSICNSYALERGDYPELSKYCPQCGAIMTSIKIRGVDNGT